VIGLGTEAGDNHGGEGGSGDGDGGEARGDNGGDDGVARGERAAAAAGEAGRQRRVGDGGGTR